MAPQAPALLPRWLVRFGYDGLGFQGWARQPGERTVEGEIRAGLARFGADPDRIALEVASRTDRGVSARANVLTLRSALAGPTLLRALNGISPELFFSAATPVDDSFRVRHARYRVYRYFDPRPVRAPRRRADAARQFRGLVDVRSIARGVPPERPRWQPIESVTSHAWRTGTLLEVRAPSFVWGMVRKIVAALREVDDGRLSLADLRAALKGRERLTLPLAEPEPLVLWDVRYPIRWTVRWTGPNRYQQEREDTTERALWARTEVLRALRTR